MLVGHNDAGVDLDTVAHKLVMGLEPDCGGCGMNKASAGSPDCAPANCSMSKPTCGAGNPPAYTSDIRLDYELMQHVRQSPALQLARGQALPGDFWNEFQNVLGERKRELNPGLVYLSLELMEYYRPGDFTRAALRLLPV